MIKHYSAGGVLLNNENKVFMIRKITRDEWALPKGTIEESEDKLQAATREIKEETGYSDIKARDDKPFEETFYKMNHPKTGEEVEKTVYFFIFDLLSDAFEPTPEMSAEELEGDWFTLDEAIEQAKFDDVKKVLEKAKTLIA